MPFKLNALTGKLDLVNAPSLSGAEILHSSLSGLSADDHTQYLLADGNRDLTGSQLVTSNNKILFRDGNQFIHSPTSSALNISANTIGRLQDQTDDVISWFGGGVTFGNTTLGSTFGMTFGAVGSAGHYIWNGATDRFNFRDDVMIGSAEKLLLRDTELSINSSADGQLDIDSDNITQMTGSIMDLNFSSGLLLDGADLVSNWTVGSANQIIFRETNEFMHSPAAGSILVEAGSKLTVRGNVVTEVGVVGDIELGDGTERDLFPNTTLKVNLGTPTKNFNELHVGAKTILGGDVDIVGDVVYTTDAGGVPFGEIFVKDNVTETTIAGAGTKVQVTIFATTGQNNNLTSSPANDDLTIIKAGKYMCTVSAVIDSIAGAASTMVLEVYKNNGATAFTNLHADRDMAGGGGEAETTTLSGIIDLNIDDTLEVWITNKINTQNYIVEDITFSLSMLGG